MKQRKNGMTSSTATKDAGDGDGKGKESMINAYYEGKKIVEVTGLGYLKDAYTKRNVVIVKLEDGCSRSAIIDYVELREE